MIKIRREVSKANMNQLSNEERKLKSIGSRVSLKAKRIDLELSIEEASKLIGISKYSLYNYENNRTVPSVEIARQIAKAYNVDIDDLRFGKRRSDVVSSK